MNIYAKRGDKVIFSHPKAGLYGHQDIAAKHLIEGEVYTVDHTNVGGWHTDVYLLEKPSIRFNSVLFSDA